MNLFYSFLIFGFLGWILELVFKSLETRKLAFDQFHWRLPFLPIYGFGAMYLTSVTSFFLNYPLLARGILYALSLTAIEFMGGIVCEAITGRKFWDYSKKPFNLYGYIDLEHFVYWFVLGVGFELLIYPTSIKMLALIR